jgi:hypothetical protein
MEGFLTWVSALGLHGFLVARCGFAMGLVLLGGGATTALGDDARSDKR